MSRPIKSIYEYFHEYSTEQINTMLENLSEEDKEIIRKRYGNDLKNPKAGKLSNEEMTYYYGVVIPRMRRTLEKPNYRKKPKRKNTVISSQDEIKDSKEVSENINNTYLDSNNKSYNPILQNNNHTLVEMFRTLTFADMMKTLSVKEATIISLRLGYINGKCYSSKTVAEFLEISQEEVIETTKKILLLFKDSINDIIDRMIQDTTDVKSGNQYIKQKNQSSKERRGQNDKL